MSGYRCLALLLWTGAAACGGGGASAQVAFSLSGTTPQAGDIDVPTSSAIFAAFTFPTDPASITSASFRVETAVGTPVTGSFVTRPLDAALVEFAPALPLEANTIYRVTLGKTIRSSSGHPLGVDVAFTFITANPTPTVRPDQLIDLGDAMVEPRYLARAARLVDGRFLITGGYTAPDAITANVEVYDPFAGEFRTLAAPMLSPRAEHTATLLRDGTVLVAGGVATPGGEPLATTEIFDPAQNTFAGGPPLQVARRWHAASELPAGPLALITGGLGSGGASLTTGELVYPLFSEFAPGQLTEGTAQHVQVTFDHQSVYIGVGNIQAMGGYYDGIELTGRGEGDSRLRGAAQRVDFDRVLVVGGDTRSMVIFDFSSRLAYGATDFLHERRGAHSLTRRGDDDLFLAAGGFNIARPGSPALDLLEVVQYVPGNIPDARAFAVANVRLPAPFAGHVATVLPDGSTLLAGGFGDGVGPHSRRAVLVRAD
ncbi:MAG: kelch repeat-containing protein [Planctomycetota bacterium]